MNYSSLFKSLSKEAYGVSQLKKLESPLGILAVIAAIPFWALFAVLIFFKNVYIFCFNALSASSNYLEQWVKDTKKDVHCATEAVIYFITTPFIFLLRCFLSIFSLVFFFLWFFGVCIANIASFGSIRWQPYISKASYDDDMVVKPEANEMIANVIVMIAFVLFCLFSLVLLITVVAGLEGDVLAVFAAIYFLFMGVAIPITFKKSLVAASENELPEI